MISSTAKLSEKLFSESIDQLPTRDGYGEGLVIAGGENDQVVVLCADLTESTRSNLFKEKFPERFIEVGVAEQNLATVGSGMANYGKIPFISSYASFSPGRNWEQIRTTVSLNDVPVKVVGAHAGISVGPDGATHQMLEDLALMRVIPNMVVISPCDAIEARKATVTMSRDPRPNYLRLHREKTPVMTTQDSPFEIGKVQIYWESRNPEVAIIATGPLVYEALLAAKQLDENGIESLVLNCHTIKPIDEKAVIKAARMTGAVVAVEEHQINGGLGGAVAELLAKHHPTPMEFVGMPDCFGESGAPDELLEKFGLKSANIIEKVKKVIEKKHTLPSNEQFQY